MAKAKYKCKKGDIHGYRLNLTFQEMLVVTKLLNNVRLGGDTIGAVLTLEILKEIEKAFPATVNFLDNITWLDFTAYQSFNGDGCTKDAVLTDNITIEFKTKPKDTNAD